LARYLGIDAGGSAARWHLRDTDENAVITGETQGFSGHVFRPEAKALANAAIAALAAEIGTADAIVAGVTGLSHGTPEALWLQAHLGRTLQASRTAVVSDIELSCRALFPAGEGIVVYAGTGSIAAHLTKDGSLITAGGKGVLIDDAGGGYWIAVNALRAIMRAEDTTAGSGWSTVLGQAMAEVLGGTDWPTVRQSFYSLDRGAIGMLAVPVGLAATAGDPEALAVLAAAGTELALLALMLEGRIGRQGISLAGRAAFLHPIILDSMQVALPGRELTRAKPDFAAAGAQLAARGTIFAELTSA
jgi:glucosamine kinase